MHSKFLKEEAIKMLNLKKTPIQISKELNVKATTIRYWARQNNIILTKGPKTKIKNITFFDCIDNEHKAYYLGWIMADGNVSIINGQYSLKIHIQERDKDIVYSFLDTIQSSNKINIREKKTPSGKIKKYCYVSLTSVYMCKRLIELGVIPRKTGHEIIPKEVPDNLLRHFIRGFFDGDGIIDTKKNRCGICGNFEILNQIIDILKSSNKNIKEKLTIFPHYKTNFLGYFLSGINFAKYLYEYLYANSFVYIKRREEDLKNVSLASKKECINN